MKNHGEMNIQLVGTGGAFDYQYGNSAAIVNCNGKRILIDCGHTVYSSLREKQKEDAFDYLLVTHTHDDHVGSLSGLILHNSIFHKKQFTLLYPDGKLLDRLKSYLRCTLGNPDKYLKYKSLDDVSEIDFWETSGKHVDYMPTFAYSFEEGNQRLVYSGDLGDGSFLFKQLEKLPKKQTEVFHDITFAANNKAHTYYKDLMRYGGEATVFGYHCDPTKAPQDNEIPLVQNHQSLLL